MDAPGGKAKHGFTHAASLGGTAGRVHEEGGAGLHAFEPSHERYEYEGPVSNQKLDERVLAVPGQPQLSDTTMTEDFRRELERQRSGEGRPVEPLATSGAFEPKVLPAPLAASFPNPPIGSGTAQRSSIVTPSNPEAKSS